MQTLNAYVVSFFHWLVKYRALFFFYLVWDSLFHEIDNYKMVLTKTKQSPLYLTSVFSKYSQVFFMIYLFILLIDLCLSVIFLFTVSKTGTHKILCFQVLLWNQIPALTQEFLWMAIAMETTLISALQ